MTCIKFIRKGFFPSFLLDATFLVVKTRGGFNRTYSPAVSLYSGYSCRVPEYKCIYTPAYTTAIAIAVGCRSIKVFSNLCSGSGSRSISTLAA